MNKHCYIKRRTEKLLVAVRTFYKAMKGYASIFMTE